MADTTTRIPLHLGPLTAEGYDIQRSGIRWLCDDGHLCRPGEVIAFCNIGLAPLPGPPGTPRPGGKPTPFAGTDRDFQVALAPRLPGRLVQSPGLSRGGFFDQLNHYYVWSPDTVIGQLECRPDDLTEDLTRARTLRMLLLNGRRAVEHADVRGGLSGGWHDRSRAWWADGEGPFGNILSLGICEQVGIFRGEQRSFLELFEMVPGPAHVAFIPDDTLVPSARVLSSQLRRTPADQEQMVADLAASFGALVQGQAGPGVLNDWIFAGSLLKALCRCPFLEPSEILTANGARTLGPAEAVILSLNSEGARHLQHKRLGYPLCAQDFRLRQGGPLVMQWLRQNFEMVRRGPEAVKRDYLELIDLVQSQTRAHLLVLNVMSSSHLDEVFCYGPFDKPLGRHLAHVWAQELNLVLHEVAHERDISIIDVDALAADLGGSHIPDRIHATGPLQAAIRAEIVATLRERGVAGFG